MVNEMEKKIKVLKTALRNLREAQEELRLRRAEYNKAVNEVIGDE